MKSGKKASFQKDKSGGVGLFVENSGQLISEIRRFLPKYVQSDDNVKYMYRKVGFRDVFMVMGAPKDSWVKFRAKGKAERWDPWSGNTLSLYEVKETVDGTMVKMPLDSDEAQIIVFSPDTSGIEIASTQLNEIATVNINNGKPEVTGFALSSGKKTTNVRIKGEVYNLSGEASVNPSPLILDGKWEFELKPTMDNSWGDFRLPVTEKMIGAEARIFRYAEEKGDTKGWELPVFDDSEWGRVTNGFGQKFWKLGPLPDNCDQDYLERELSGMVQVNPSKQVVINGKSYYWTSYNFSWRFGVEDDPGHQGYHGLKEEITDEFICLGKPTNGRNETLYSQEEEGSVYYLWTSAYSYNVVEVIADSGGLSPSSVYLNGEKTDNSSKTFILRKGNNPLLLKYENSGRGHFVLLEKNSSIRNERTPL